MEDRVREIIKAEIDGMSRDEAEAWFDDLEAHGCVSGLVGAMIYYSDTVAFFESHKDEINGLLANCLNEDGAACPAELFGVYWDKSDPLALERNNRNLLAWFAFEETAHRLRDEILDAIEDEEEA